MDLETLLEDRSEDAPSGEDLEYDPAFAEMERLAQPGEERVMGDQVIPATEPEWKDVAKAVLSVLERSHDLRAGVLMAVAELRTEGLAGFARGTGYLRGCLERHWSTCHPQLDADDDDDPTMRVNAVLSLADRERVVQALRRAPLTASRAFGGIGLRDIEQAADPEGADEDAPDPAAVSAAFQDTDDDWLRASREAVRAALADVAAIDAVFMEHVPGQGPDLDPLSRVLRQIAARFDAELDDAEAEAEAEDADAEEGAPGGGPRPRAPGAISSPADVRATIDRIVAYYQREEPSSPVPILLGRARRLVGADFLTIMRDMAPDGLENVQHVGGITDEEDG